MSYYKDKILTINDIPHPTPDILFYKHSSHYPNKQFTLTQHSGNKAERGPGYCGCNMLILGIRRLMSTTLIKLTGQATIRI